MAGLADVEAALVSVVLSAVTVSGLAPVPLVYRGWPQAAQLDPDIRAGRAHVTVRAESGGVRNTTRFQDEWETVARACPTITGVASGNTITFGGTGGAGQVAGVSYGNGIVRWAYAYRLTAADTPASVAAAFAASIPFASASGAVLTLANAPAWFDATADASAAQELARQEGAFRITIWAPSPTDRDTLDGAIALLMAETRNLALSDGTLTEKPKLRTIYTDDTPQKEQIWRRDYVFGIEYPTVLTQTQPTVLFGGIVMRGGVVPNVMTALGELQPASYVLIDSSGNVVTDGAETPVGILPATQIMTNANGEIFTNTAGIPVGTL